MTRPKFAVFFDLDGTLIDSAPDIDEAAAATLRDLSLPPLSPAQTRDYIGDGMKRFVKRALTRCRDGEPEESLLAAAMARMESHYARFCIGAAERVYPGVAETLTTLREIGAPMACITNKPAQFTGPVLAACGLDIFFSVVISGDSLPHKKPHPAPLREACRRLSVRGEQSWMVGDSHADSAAAAAAGCRFAFASYGYHRRKKLPPSEKIIYNFAEVLQTVEMENL